jgi:hypothetical protein
MAALLLESILWTAMERLNQTRPPLPVDEVMSTVSESHAPITAGAEMTTDGATAVTGL